MSDYVEQAKRFATDKALITLNERETIELLALLEEVREGTTGAEEQRIGAMVTLVLNKMTERARE